jgi:hypothetical protein
LLVDTAIHDPGQAYKKISKLMEICDWESSPKLSVELLDQLKKERLSQRYDDPDIPPLPVIVIYDKDGNRCFLEYGPNGYSDTLGYRFETLCNHGDTRTYPLFKRAIEILEGELLSFDGGGDESYREWERGDI